MLHVFKQFKSDFTYEVEYLISKIKNFLNIKTTYLPKKLTDYLLSKNWLWVKIPTGNKIVGYRHFIFRTCVGYDYPYLSKDEIVKRWHKACRITGEHTIRIPTLPTKQEIRDTKIDMILNGR